MTRPGSRGYPAPVLLAIDVGNTNIVLGAFEGPKLRQHWRLETVQNRTADEYGILVRQLFAFAELDPRAVDAVVVSSVVPPMAWALAAEMLSLNPV